MKTKLTKLRLAKGLTQEEMAKRVGLSSLVIWRIEKGRKPRPKNMAKIADAYGIPTLELVEILYGEELEGN